MKLYSMTGTCALAVHIALEWAGAPYQLELMPRGENRSPAYLALNPSGQVPAIRLDDGEVLTQAAALLTWIVDSRPEAGLGPSCTAPLERFRLAETLAYLVSEVHGAYGPYFAPQRFSDDEAQHPALKAKALGQVAEHLLRLDQRLGAGRYLLNDRRSVADAYLYVLVRWADFLEDGIKPFPNLARFRAAIEADPAVAKVLREERLQPLGAG